MSQPLDVLGGITAEKFLAEYWQKKPLLVRNALPEIINLLEPNDVKELALDETVTARLIKQKDKDQNQWTVKSSPLIKGDFQKLPQLWTLLVQAVDHYSFDIAELWKKFPFIPQWRRDDIMVSYAPQGGSVGKHFDFYDVFLVQGHGHRRWQLGQTCNSETEFVAGQPLKLLPEIEVNFDEILAPGDLLYVPPGLSHYGVAEDECLTFSFGFRMPNLADIVDRTSEKLADQSDLLSPVIDIHRKHISQVGEINAEELAYLKAKILDHLQHSNDIDNAIMMLMSEPKYLDSVPEPDEIEANDLREILDQGYQLMIEPASRLIYSQNNRSIDFWGNGESFCISEEFSSQLKNIADGEIIAFDQSLSNENILQDIAHLLNESILMMVPPEG